MELDGIGAGAAVGGSLQPLRPEPDGYILDELAGPGGAVIEALARFHQHRGGCAQCANWKRVQGVPSRLCGTGWELYSAVERAEKEAR